MEIRSKLGDIQLFLEEGCRFFSEPRETITARNLSEVIPALLQAERLAASGNHVVGCVAYEAAPAFDPALEAYPVSEMPLVWFGVYASTSEYSPFDREIRSFRVDPWQSGISQSDHSDRVQAIRSLIASGDTYQVNFTFPMVADFAGDPYSWFQAVLASQPTNFAAYMDLGECVVASFSPELFFRLDQDKLTTRPMKGTRPRVGDPGKDLEMRDELASHPKERAENVMIVDLLRNDMGRISRSGSVNVERLFEIERYQTVWQMTSTITSRTDASIVDIFRALFPCGSVTGAPKVRTTAIIKDLEAAPRGVYCGAIGWIAPGARTAQFSVPIRTAMVDRNKGKIIYPVGSGVTYDSVGRDEYEECLAKATIVSRPPCRLDLLESLLLDDTGYFMLDEHLDRMEHSSVCLGFRMNRSAIEKDLLRIADSRNDRREKVRLTLNRDGDWRIEREEFKSFHRVRLGLAAQPVNTPSLLLMNKTTFREHYREALETRPDCDDVVLWNNRGEITESTIANIVVKIGGEWYTPPISCGLLPGVFRARLIREGSVRERKLTKDDLAQAESVALVNSVRTWMDTDWIF